MWSTVRRRALIGLVAAVCATAVWAPPAQAASAKKSGSEIPSVGQLQVVNLPPTTTKPDRNAKTPGKPFLGANAKGLAKAKGHAKKADESAPSSTRGPLAGIFNGTNQPGVTAADEGFCCTPPDPTGAIGPNNYVEFINTTIAVFNRSLTQLSSQDMATFVAAPSGTNVSDPQVQWDPRAGRWFYAGIAFASHKNYLVYGWSKTADPNNLSSGWCHFAAFTGNQLADYPKLGHDDNFVLLAANLYDDTTGDYVFTTAAIWAQPKPPAGNLTTCVANGLTAFADPQHRLLNADGTSAFTPIPVNIADASPVGYIVAGHSPVAPLPSDPTGPQTNVMLWHTTLQGGQPHLFADGDLTVGSFDVPLSAPQPGGGPPIDTLDARLTQAVGHADPDAAGSEAIWTQHAIDGPGGRSVVRWYEILGATGAVRQQGTVQSAADFLWNASISPSIAGNDAAVFYNRGSATQLVAAAAQSRTSATPVSTLNAGELVLATSSDVDVDFSCSSPYGPPCRWGDYSGASPDPINAGVVWGTTQLDGQSFFGFPQWVTQNFAVTTSGTPPPPPIPCTGVTWNAPSPASPQAPGTQVTFSGTATGCPHAVYQFWVQPPGGSWTILQAYSSASTATWNTTGLAAGTYLFDVWAKDAGSTADWDAHVSPNPAYTLQVPNTCTAVTWNAPSPTSPQTPGVQVTLKGTATGCSSPVYQFWVQPPGGAWTILQAYGASSTATWNTAGQATGTYIFDIWAKQSGSTASWEAHVSPNPTYTLQTGAPCSAVTLAFNPASPQTAGASVGLTGSATGCPNPQYEFWVQPPGGAWSLLQSYGATPTATWNTSGMAAGTYLFDVWARQSGSTADWEAHISPNPTYTLQAPVVCTAVTWNAPSPASPQAPGTQVALNVSSTGCPNPVYQFWVQPQGGVWSILQPYSASASANWNTTGLATGTYAFDVWAKQSGSTADWQAHLSPNPTYTLQTGAACSGVTLAFNPTSPQSPGAAVTLTAAASGCPNPQYQFWIQPPGGSWSILQPYSSSATAPWNTGGAGAGTYLFDVWARQSGSAADWQAHVSPSPTYTLVACATVTWNAPNPASPQAPGTQVTLSAAAAGCPNPLYQFWVLPPGGSWTVVQAYSTRSTATWNTTGLATGVYQFDVWARQSGSGASWEAHLSPNPTYTLQAGSPCTAVTWNAPSPASPQAPGTQVTLSGTAAGCPNPQFQFYILPPGGSWTILQAYSSSASMVWNTGGSATGSYQFDIWVRQLGSSASYEAHVSPNPTYTLQTGAPCTSVTLGFNPASPRAAGTSVQLSAAATGCPNPEYEFWVQAPGGQWTMLQGYGAGSTVTWNTTGLAPGTYLFDVWVRQSGSTAQYEAHIAPNPTYTLS